MRQFLQKFRFIILGVLIIATAVVFYINTRKVPAPPPYAGDANFAFFVDELTNDETVLPADRVPPLPGKDGNDTLVMAIKFKADTEPAPKTWYYIKYPAAIRDQVAAMPPDDLERLNTLESTRLVRSPEPNSPWLRATDPAAEKIVTVPDESPGHPRRVVFPEKPQ